MRVDCTVEGWTLDPLFWNNQIPCFIKYYSFQGFAYSLHLKQPPLSLSTLPLLKILQLWENLNTQFCSCTGSLILSQGAALCLQVTHGDWDDWMIHVHAVEAKYFCAVTVSCRPSYLSFLLRLRQSCPDEPLKHRNIGKIPQKLSHNLSKLINFPLWWML